MNWYYVYSADQYLLDRTLKGLYIFLKLLVKTALYLPHLFTGYLLSQKLLSNDAGALTTIATIGLLSYSIYLLFSFLKGYITTLKRHRKLLWIPLFMVAVLYSCILPLWMLWELTQDFIQKLWGGNTVLVVLTIATAFWLYYQHHFLRPIKY